MYTPNTFINSCSNKSLEFKVSLVVPLAMSNHCYRSVFHVHGQDPPIIQPSVSAFIYIIPLATRSKPILIWILLGIRKQFGQLYEVVHTLHTECYLTPVKMFLPLVRAILFSIVSHYAADCQGSDWLFAWLPVSTKCSGRDSLFR